MNWHLADKPGTLLKPKHNDQNETRIVRAIFLSIAAAYAAVAGCLANLHAFWSSDCGARFAMIRNWIQHGSLIHLYYPASAADPSGKINGLAYFLYHQTHGFTAIYAPLYPFVTGILYRIFGWYGLSIVPVLSGLGTLWLLYLAARRLNLRSRLLLPIAAAFGTPLLIYSVVYWDHVTMMFLAALCAYWLLRALQVNSVRYATFAGMSLGMGFFIHELMLALAIAVALASIPLAWRRDGRRLIAGLLAGLVPLGLLWLGPNYFIYDTWIGPHAASNMGGNPQVHGYRFRYLWNVSGFLYRAQMQLAGSNAHVPLSNIQPDFTPYYLILGYLIGAYWVFTCFFGVDWKAAVFLSLGAGGLAAYLVLRIPWAHGLFLAAPILIPALAIPWRAVRSKTAMTETESRQITLPENLFYAFLSRTCWIFGLIVIASMMVPIVGWGDRFLLTMLPLLLLLATRAMEMQYQSARPPLRHAVTISLSVLVGLSIACQIKGIIVVHRNMLYNQDLDQQISAVRSPVLVFADVGTAAELSAINVPVSQFLVQDNDDVALLASVLRYLKMSEFTFVGDPDLAPNLSSARPFSNEYFVPASSRSFIRKNAIEDGPDLTITTFILKTRPTPKH